MTGVRGLFAVKFQAGIQATVGALYRVHKAVSNAVIPKWGAVLEQLLQEQFPLQHFPKAGHWQNPAISYGTGRAGTAPQDTTG